MARPRKLSPEQEREAISLARDGGHTMAEIGRALGVSAMYVSRLCRRAERDASPGTPRGGDAHVLREAEQFAGDLQFGPDDTGIARLRKLDNALAGAMVESRDQGNMTMFARLSNYRHHMAKSIAVLERAQAETGDAIVIPAAEMRRAQSTVRERLGRLRERFGDRLLCEQCGVELAIRLAGASGRGEHGENHE